MGSVSMENEEIIRILDLTLLDRGASEEDLIGLCERAVAHGTAAVCVFSEHVGFVRSLLPEEVRVASVVGGFPEGWRDPSWAYFWSITPLLIVVRYLFRV